MEARKDPDGAVAAPAKAALERRRLSWAFLAASVSIVAGAAFLRFWDLGRGPIWMDEAYSALVARLPLRAVVFEQLDVHPPLFYVVQTLWMRAAPALSLMRIPAAAFGVVSVAALIAAVADLVSPAVAILAGAFVALSTSDIYFSQEARMYTILTLGLFLAGWGALRMLEPKGGGKAGGGPRFGYDALYVLGAAAAIYTHFVALVYLLALNLSCLAAWAVAARAGRGRGYLVRWLAANLVLLVLALPWLVRLSTSAGGFPGFGAMTTKETAWVVAEALGYPGLPRPLEYAGNLFLLALLALGCRALWRRGRRGLVVAGLGTLAGYPVLIILLSRITPIVAVRVFLPLLMFLSLFVGAALASIRPLWAQAGAVCLALGLMACSTVKEHAAHTEYENVPAALAFADRHGLAAAPVVTCNFMIAGSVWAAAPGRGDYILNPDGEVMRFDAGYMRALRMPFSVFVKASPARINAFLGGGYLVPGGLAALARRGPGLVAITGPCTTPFGRQITGALAPLGLRPTASAAFPGGDHGHAIISSSLTAATLFAPTS